MQKSQKNRNKSTSFYLFWFVISKMRNQNLPDFVIFQLLIQGDKKHANWLFFIEIIQPNLPKFADNLIRSWRVQIWSQILTNTIPNVPKSRSKSSKNGKNRFIRFYSFRGWVKLILCMKNVSKQLQCMGKCLFKEDLAISNINLFWLFIKNQKIKIFRFS